VNIYLAEGEDADMGEIVNRVVGGLVTYNGVSFEAPEPGTTDDDMKFWVRNLGAEDLPFIRQGSGEDLKRQIDGGGIVLVPAGANKYYLQRVDTGTLLTTGGNASQRATITWPGLEVVRAAWNASPEGVHEQISEGVMPIDYSAQNPTGAK
jgi:hypothetical protein